LAFTAVTINTV